MLCFSRDTDILSVFNQSSSSPIHGVLKGRPATIDNTVIYPPSGVIPFHGFTMYGQSNIFIIKTEFILYRLLKIQ